MASIERPLHRYAGTDDFELVFPSEHTRSIFYDYINSLLSSTVDDVAARDFKEGAKVMKYEFELDENDERVVLGRGSFGCVFSALDLDTKKLVCSAFWTTAVD